jgi:hypothetical protein
MPSPTNEKAPGANQGQELNLRTDPSILNQKHPNKKRNQHHLAIVPIGEFAGQNLSSLPDFALQSLIDHVDRDHAFSPALDTECLRRIRAWAASTTDDRTVVRIVSEDSGYARELIEAGWRVLAQRYAHSPALVSHLAGLRRSLQAQISYREPA